MSYRNSHDRIVIAKNKKNTSSTMLKLAKINDISNKNQTVKKRQVLNYSLPKKLAYQSSEIYIMAKFAIF